MNGLVDVVESVLEVGPSTVIIPTRADEHTPRGKVGFNSPTRLLLKGKDYEMGYRVGCGDAHSRDFRRKGVA